MLREMTPRERAIVARLLERPFPGRDALAVQLATARVNAVHPEQDECFELEVTNRLPADVLSNRPVGLIALDETGVWTYDLCVDREGIAYEMQAVRSGDDAAPPDLDSMRAEYQQQGMYIRAPIGALVPGYLHEGIEATGTSGGHDSFTCTCAPLDRLPESPFATIRQGQFFETLSPTSQTVAVRGKDAKRFVSEGFDMLEWYESPGLLVSIRSRGLVPEEVIRIAEGLRRATSEG